MITHNTQGLTKAGNTFVIGARVRIGFMCLRVIGIEPTPGDGKPDAYRLQDERTKRTYRFTPHYGLARELE